MSFSENIAELVLQSERALIQKANHWERVPLLEVAQVLNGFAFKSAFFNESNGVPLIRIRDVTSGTVKTLYEGEVPDGYWVESGDLIVGMDGDFNSRLWDGPRALLNQRVCKLTPDTSFMDIRFLHAVLPGYLQLINDHTSAVTVKHLSSRTLGETPIPLPPLPEQQRIVSKLDTLSARTTTARTHLTAILTLVEKYRQQVFELAFSGALTRDFRENSDEEAAGTLPSSWQVTELGEITEIQGGIQVGKKRPPGTELVEVPYLRVANVQRGWLNLDEIKNISVTQQEKERLLLKTGDVLMNEGGDRDKLGRGWIWRGEVPECIHQNHVFRIRLIDSSFPPEYISHFANAKGQQYFFDEGTQTTNLASISKRKVSGLPVPIPPLEEAKEILHRIDTAFAKIDRLAAEAEKALKLTDRLDERILAKAFAGELVPQDPNDEPASVLLDRIREDRANAPKKTRSRRTKATAMKKAPKDLLLADSADWPANGVTSEELATRVSMPHTDLRDALFELLGGTKPQLEQVFDKAEERMRLKRVVQ